MEYSRAIGTSAGSSTTRYPHTYWPGIFHAETAAERAKSDVCRLRVRRYFAGAEEIESTDADLNNGVDNDGHITVA
jgi:hypothetical protein